MIHQHLGQLMQYSSISSIISLFKAQRKQEPPPTETAYQLLTPDHLFKWRDVMLTTDSSDIILENLVAPSAKKYATHRNENSYIYPVERIVRHDFSHQNAFAKFICEIQEEEEEMEAFTRISLFLIVFPHLLLCRNINTEISFCSNECLEDMEGKAFSFIDKYILLTLPLVPEFMDPKLI